MEKEWFQIKGRPVDNLVTEFNNTADMLIKMIEEKQKALIEQGKVILEGYKAVAESGRVEKH